MKKLKVSLQLKKKLKGLTFNNVVEACEDKGSPTTNPPMLTSMPVNSPCPEYQGERKIIEWVNGIPVPKTERILNEANVKDIVKAASSMEFTQDDDLSGIYPELYGLSYMEAATIQLARQAAMGDQKAIDMLLDRNIGKPKQTNENKNMNMTYQDFLDEISKPAKPLQSEVFDIG